ncbi:MarR family transcriptional regulator [Lachnospiraceae bacterium ZAX-1]
MKEKPHNKTYPCHCLNVRRTGQMITDMYNKNLAPSGLTVSQFSILSQLGCSESVSVSEIAAALSLERTTLVRNLKILEKKGLICDNASKGRSRQITLSEKGASCYDTARPFWENAQSNLEDAIGVESLALLANTLARLSEFE